MRNNYEFQFKRSKVPLQPSRNEPMDFRGNLLNMANNNNFALSRSQFPNSRNFDEDSFDFEERGVENNGFRVKREQKHIKMEDKNTKKETNSKLKNAFDSEDEISFGDLDSLEDKKE